MPSTRRAQCTEDCRCVLCRELKDCKMSANGVQVQQQVGHEGANFILRRAVPFLPKPPAREEWREIVRRHESYEKSSTLEDRSRRGGNDSHDVKPWTSSGDIAKTGKDVSHKTVIYFGDSNPRQKEDKPRQQQQPPSPPPLPEDACVQMTSRCKETSETSRNDETEIHPRDRSQERDEDVERRRECAAMENGDPKAAHEIVVNVSPSREDVLRIEEDESQLEDYWSLPGDTSGFKADWSFVQQWRLRG